VLDLQDGSYAVNYIPMALGVHLVEITLHDVAIAGTPFEIDVINGTPDDEVDVQKTQVVFAESTADELGRHKFIIAAKNAAGNVVHFSSLFKVRILSPEKLEVKNSCLDNGDGTHSVKFKPELDGVYSVQVDYQGSEPLKGSPFKVDWKINDKTLDIISVEPSAEKPKSAPNLVAALRDRSNSAPVLPARLSVTEPNASASAPLSPNLGKLSLAQPSYLPKQVAPTTSAPPRARSPSSARPPGSPTGSPVASPSFLPKTAPQAAARVPPKNPPKNPSGPTKWTPASASKPQQQ